MEKEYSVKRPAIIFGIIIAIFVEYYMIVIERYPNFQSAYGVFGGLSVYLVISLLSLGFLKLIFKRIDGKRFMLTFLLTLTITIIVGLFWSYYTGYVNPELFDPAWQLTHDFIYVALVTQFIVLAILLLGTVKVEHSQKDDDYEWEDVI